MIINGIGTLQNGTKALLMLGLKLMLLRSLLNAMRCQEVWLIKRGGVEMPFLARGVTVYGRKNRFKTHLFTDREKAQRFWEKCKRLGLDAQLVY